ncbi:hypothetical protein [Rahnella sp. PCH160]|uniref:hypothetical protein n=1 Tax=Rahnella sp. PCH160 TaxID=3447928 RepID=UPI0039FCEC9D
MQTSIFESFWPLSKITPQEWWKTERVFARFVTRTKGTAQRRDFAAINEVAET